MNNYKNYSIFRRWIREEKLVGYSVMCIGFVGMGLFVSSESASAAEWYNPNMNVKRLSVWADKSEK